jgi:hypothetical protein
LALATRAFALFGGILWALVTVYCLAVVASGFVGWAAPNVYVTALVVICGLAVNVLLFRRAEDTPPLSTVALMLASLALSAIVIGIFAYMAVGP